MKWCILCILLLVSCNKRYNFNTIHFHAGTADIVELDSISLYENLDIVRENPDVDIVLEGHTNSVGGDSANLVLSNMRAQAIQAWLVTRDVNGDRITPIGYGESSPVADNRTAEGRALNDRVEFVPDE